MTEFKPPISSYDSIELIRIAHATDDEWQAEARRQAKEELKNRGVSEMEQQEVVQEWRRICIEEEKARQKQLKLNETESYKWWEIAVLFFFGPYLFIKPHIFNTHTLFTLRDEHYYLKFRQRLAIFILSFLGWYLFIEYSK